MRSQERRQPALDSKLSNLIASIMSGNHVCMTTDGIVYLLYFERPYNGLMQHYVGFIHDLDQRLADHREGTGGSATTRLAFEQGITFTLARTWSGTLKLKRQIKARGPSNYRPLCARRRSDRESAPSNLIGAKGFA